MMNRNLANTPHNDFALGEADHHDAVAFAPPEKQAKPTPVKRKRRSPEKPWKKPKDMPKRPLSAYNLFFRDERERLLNPDGKAPAEAAPGGKKQKKTSGIGFANLAKTIAAKWKTLDADVKAPYEKIATGEKKRYDEAVAAWRVKQAEKKKQAKKEAEEKRRSMREAPGFSSERSVDSFSESSNPYPTEWFHSTMPVDASDHTSDRDDSERSNVPHEVDMSSPGAYEARRTFDIPGVTNAGSWSTPGRPDAYYYNFADPYMRSSPELPRGSYLRRGLFPQDPRGAPPPPPYAGYPEFYPNDQAPMYQQFQPSRRSGDMRMPRAASMPMQQQQQDFSSHRSPSRESYRGGVSGSSHPRSASMPLATGNIAAIETPGPDEPEVEAANISIQQTIPEDRPPIFPEPVNPHGTNPADDSSYVGNTFQSLTDTLDDDAISFITSMKYH